MTPEQFRNLDQGDIIRAAGGTCSYIVMANYGGRVTAAKTVDLTNPADWALIVKRGEPVRSYPVDTTGLGVG